jgi:hypothetical protein
MNESYGAPEAPDDVYYAHVKILAPTKKARENGPFECFDSQLAITFLPTPTFSIFFRRLEALSTAFQMKCSLYWDTEI